MRINRYIEHLDSLDSMKKYPKEIYYIGDIELLKRPKVSIVGSRRPNNYTKEWTYKISKELSERGVVVVSGGAMGVDAVAHLGAGANSTMCVCASGLDIIYPKVNRKLIEDIFRSGLAISQFQKGFSPTPWSFVVRNELVVALGDILIITEANLNSGSMRSAEFALNMGKEIYVLPHRLDESLGTNLLLSKGLAKPIYNIEKFCSKFGVVPKVDGIKRDEFFYFCQNSPTLDEAVSKFGSRVYEAELEGLIEIENGIIKLA
jgi:DNA processing protein